MLGATQERGESRAVLLRNPGSAALPGHCKFIGKKLRGKIKTGKIPAWAEGQNRPKDYEDVEGYAFAWTRVQFLKVLSKDGKQIPQMIELIKLGSTDQQALEQIFGKKEAQLEQAYRAWLPLAAQQDFR